MGSLFVTCNKRYEKPTKKGRLPGHTKQVGVHHSYESLSQAVCGNQPARLLRGQVHANLEEQKHKIARSECNRALLVRPLRLS
jgi:hypothetical protein